MRLSDDVSLVGGGPVGGFGLTSDVDAHVYLVDGGTELALIDCGMGTRAGMERVLANIRSDGYDPNRITRLFLTHYHTDHAGGAARYRENLGVTVVASRLAQLAIEGADGVATGLVAAQHVGIFPSGYAPSPCTVDEPIDEDSHLKIGRLTLEAVETPGHCTGHLSYLVTGSQTSYLFAGDAVFCGGKILLQALADCDLQQSLASVRKLSRLNFDSLLPGHGAVALQSGPTHVQIALNAIDRLQIPANLG